MSIPLTARQMECLQVIQAGTRFGLSPSYDEIKDAMGLASKSGIHRLVTALEERGFVTRQINRARSLHVVKRIEQSSRPVLLSPEVMKMAEEAAWRRGENVHEYIETAVIAMAEVDLA